MMTCIGWNRQLDPELYDFYARNLLEPGWAGLLALAEAEYIRDCLEQDSKLRLRWGIRRCCSCRRSRHVGHRSSNHPGIVHLARIAETYIALSRIQTRLVA